MQDIKPLPGIRTAHYHVDGVWTGEAVCRAGHTLPLPDPEISAWQDEHVGCEAARWVGDEAMSVPCGAFADLVEVAEYVSLGRHAVDHQPDGAPYPDAAARRALGALDECGLLPRKDGE